MISSNGKKCGKIIISIDPITKKPIYQLQRLCEDEFYKQVNEVREEQLNNCISYRWDGCGGTGNCINGFGF